MFQTLYVFGNILNILNGVMLKTVSTLQLFYLYNQSNIYCRGRKKPFREIKNTAC